jgi:hypothetical protein
MPRDLLHRGHASAVLVALFGMFLVVVGNTGQAFAADDDDEGTWDQRIMRSVLRGIGLRNGREGSIEYKERPPLVVPPNRELPPPDTTGSINQTGPGWPSDPDVAKRKAAKAAAAGERKWTDVSTWGDALRPSELKAGKTDALPQEPGIKPGQTVETSTQLRPDELGYKGDSMWSSMLGLSHTFDKEKPAEGAKFLREPPRATLTEPPKGYLTPSPEQPYGLNYKETQKRDKPVFDHQTVGVER